MFKKAETDQIHAELEGVAKRLDRAIGLLQGETAAGDVRKLKRQLTDKQIEWDREKEKWDREKRDVEHMVGLQKKRAEQERELAVQQAKLEVREGNLKAKEEQFEERLEAITKGLKEQVDYLRTDIIGSIMERLPTFNVNTVLRPALTPANGHAHVDGEAEEE